jgi:hypothetical protein
MKTIIAGSRDGITKQDVENAVKMCGWTITSVVSGTARGVDRMGEDIAKRMRVPIHRYPANWTAYGKAAGHIRNAVMADNAEALVAVWDGDSDGTRGMINAAKKRGLKVFVHHISK